MSRRLEDDMSGRKERVFGIWRLSLGTKGRFEIGSDGPEVAYRTVIEQASKLLLDSSLVITC